MRIGIIGWVLVALALYLGIAIKLIAGGLFNYMQVVILAAPFFFALLVRYRNFWHIMLLVSLFSGRLTSWLPGFSKLGPIIPMVLVLLFFFIIDGALHRRAKIEMHWEEKAIWFMACLLTLRFLYDRPGFVALGAETGGITLALNYLVAGWSYFVVQWVASSAKFTRKQLKVTVWVVLLLFMHAVFMVFRSGEMSVVRLLGEQRAWMLTAISLSLIITSRKMRLKWQVFFMTAFGFLFMAAMSTYRARVFYILLNILGIAYGAKCFKRVAAVMLAVGLLGIAGLIALQDHLPVGLARFASLFTEVQRVEESVGAYGLQDSFREELYRIGWQHICQHPLSGRGFGLNVHEALSVLAVSDAGTTLDMVELGGAYHNSIVGLAVTAGIPSALLFGIVLFSIPRKFGRMLMTLQDGDLRTWGLTVFGLFFSVLCMLLLNGGPREVIFMMIILGYMRGMMRNPMAKLQIEANVDEEKDGCRPATISWSRPGTMS